MGSAGEVVAVTDRPSTGSGTAGPTPPGAGAGGWHSRVLRAWSFAAGDFDAAVVALSGFLIRGGVAVLAVPSVILPSFLGVAAVLNVNALGIDGQPTPWLITTLIWVSAAGAVWLILASLVGSAVDLWLIRAVAGSDAEEVRRPQGFPDPVLLLDMAAVRIGCLLPLGAAVWAAYDPIYQAAYSELTAPTNLTDPIVLRVGVRAAGPLALIVAAWLAGETVSTVAIRRLVMGDGVVGALRGTLGQLVRRPLTSLLTVATTTAASVAALTCASVATGLAFGLVLHAARIPQQLALSISVGGFEASRDLRPIVFLGTVLVLALAWVLALAVAGVASAWRSAAWTEETAAAVVRDRPAGDDAAPEPPASP